MGDIVPVKEPVRLRRRDLKYFVERGQDGYLIRIANCKFPYLAPNGKIVFKKILVVEYHNERLTLLDLESVKKILRENVQYYTETPFENPPKNYQSYGTGFSIF